MTIFNIAAIIMLLSDSRKYVYRILCWELCTGRHHSEVPSLTTMKAS